MPCALEFFERILAVRGQSNFMALALEDLANQFTNGNLIICN